MAGLDNLSLGDGVGKLEVRYKISTVSGRY